MSSVVRFARCAWLIFMLFYGACFFLGVLVGTFIFGGCFGFRVLWTIAPEGYCSIWGALPPLILGPISICVAAMHIYVTSRLVVNDFPQFSKFFKPISAKKGWIILGLSQVFTVVMSLWTFIFWVICNGQSRPHSPSEADICWTQKPTEMDGRVNTLRFTFMIGSALLAAGCFIGVLVNCAFGSIKDLHSSTSPTLGQELPVMSHSGKSKIQLPNSLPTVCYH